MTRKTKILLISAAVLIILLILLLLLLRRAPKSVGPLTNQNTAPYTLPPSLPPLAPPAVIEPPPTGPVEQDPIVVARDFAERYGSYSNENNYQNLRDLFPQMTSAMQSHMESFMASNPPPSGAYSGVTTKAVSTSIIERTETSVRLTISTQRIEATETNSRARVYYQTAEISLTKNGLKWLVDEFIWK